MSLGGALSDFVKRSKKSDMLTITIIEALPTILSGWDERLVEKVNEVLLKKEIRIRTSSAVIRVENDSGTSCSNIYLSDSESQIPSSLTVWTAGVKGYEIPISPEVEKTKDDRIILNEFCQVGSYPNIFCIGDIAAVKDENGKLYPPLVQIAVREAKYLSRLYLNTLLLLIMAPATFSNRIIASDPIVAGIFHPVISISFPSSHTNAGRRSFCLMRKLIFFSFNPLTCLAQTP